MPKFEKVYLRPEDTFIISCQVKVVCGEHREGTQPTITVDWASARRSASLLLFPIKKPDEEDSDPIGWIPAEDAKNYISVYATQFANMYYYYKEIPE